MCVDRISASDPCVKCQHSVKVKGNSPRAELAPATPAGCLDCVHDEHITSGVLGGSSGMSHHSSMSRNFASCKLFCSVFTVHGMPRRAWLLRAKLSRRRTVQLPIPKEKENQ